MTEPTPKPAFYDRIRHLPKRLRVMLLCTGLLVVPGIGQFIAIRDLNTTGHIGDLALLFAMFGVFAVPTSLIITGAIFITARHHVREQERVLILGALNLLIALNLIWFFAHQCSWSQVFGIALRTCH